MCVEASRLCPHRLQLASFLHQVFCDSDPCSCACTVSFFPLYLQGVFLVFGFHHLNMMCLVVPFVYLLYILLNVYL